MIALTLTYPPSANRLWRNVDGKTLKSAEYRRWIKANEGLGWGLKTLFGPYQMEVRATAPDRRRRDLDNLAKPIGDLLQAIGAVANDSDLSRLVMEWAFGPSAGVDVVVTPYVREAA